MYYPSKFDMNVYIRRSNMLYCNTYSSIVEVYRVSENVATRVIWHSIYKTPCKCISNIKSTEIIRM